MSSLPVIYQGTGEIIADIVSIPGLPDLVPQYRLKDHNRWLRDVLSHQVPSARIMSFYYDLAKISSSASWKDLTDQMLHFLFALIHRREDISLARRPLIFICFSFGSIILKKALIVARHEPEFGEIHDNTVGILFLGSLHNENHPSFEELALRCAAIEFRTTGHKASVIEKLKDSEGLIFLKEAMSGFRDLSLSFMIRTFCEIKKSVYYSSRWAPAKASCVCPENLATLGWANEQVVPVDLDHVQLSMFPSRIDEFFGTFMSHLNDVIASGCPAIVDRGLPQFELQVGRNLITASSPGTVCVTSLQSSSSLSDVAQLNIVNVNLPCYVTAPYEENPYFTGREQVLADIEAALHPSIDGDSGQASLQPRTYALCGLGGMGKTQIALRYLFLNLDAYSVILWSHADSRVKLSDSYSRFANELGLEVYGTGEDSFIQAVKNFLLKTKEKWLLIFDNLDNDERGDLLNDFWPPANDGAILLTSRNNSLVRKFGGREISELELDSAVALLKKLSLVENAQQLDPEVSAEEDLAARELVQRIGCFPLGIGQAANLILNDSCQFSEFLAGYENEDLIRDETGVPIVSRKAFQYQHSLGTVWNANFDNLSADGQKLIYIMAFGDPDRFQLRILSDGSKSSNHPDVVFMNNPKKIHRCVMSLLRSSLVRRNANLATLGLRSRNEELREVGMHRLVQVSCHVKMSYDQRKHYFGVAISLLKHSWPTATRHAPCDPSLWPLQQLLLPHVQSLSNYYRASCEEGKPLLPEDKINRDFPQLFYNAGWFCWEKGMHEIGRELLEAAKEYCLSHAEIDHALLADIHGGIGSFDSETNDFQGTYENFQNQWKHLQAALDAGQLQRPNILEVFGLGRIANGLMALKRYQDAETYYRRCFDAWDLDGLPGDRLLWKSNFANCLCLQGKLEEAAATIVPSIKDRYDMSTFRPGVGLTAQGSVEIAQGEALLSVGEPEKAEKKFDAAFASYSQALINSQKLLGTHRRTADVYYKLGTLLQRKREYSKALEYVEQALEIYQMHPAWFKNDVARTIYRLGSLHQDMGDLTKGRSFINDAEILRKTLVPPEEWAPASNEDCYNDLIMFWSR